MTSRLPLFLLQFIALCTISAFEGVSANAVIHSWEPHNLARTRCVEGFDRFVPAHVYYCLAIRSYGVHEYRSMDHFLNQSALWGSKQADYVMGYMALTGDHQVKNKPKALAWYSLAAERHTAFFQKAYEDLRAEATPKELSQAQAILKSLGPNYTDAVAAVRAEERYRDGMKWLESKQASSNICISGMITPRGTTGTANPTVAGHCPTPFQLTAEVNSFAYAVLQDWGGHTEVKPLQQIKTTNGSHGKS